VLRELEVREKRMIVKTWKGKTTTLEEKSSDQSDDGLSRPRPNFQDTRKIFLIISYYWFSSSAHATWCALMNHGGDDDDDDGDDVK
jgi:hypothetical protein